MDNVQPVEIKARRRIASNSKWEICFDHVVDRRGNEVADYLVIRRPSDTARDGISGITVVPVLDQRIILIRNYRHPLHAHFWEVVRGFVDHGETAMDAALRELAEETGLYCAPEDIVPLGLSAPEPSTIAGRAALFAARCRDRGGARDAGELGLGTWQAFDRSTVAAMLDRHQIEDATSEIALRRYLARGV